ncbi:MAG: hypothetical protein QOE90_3689 [Thermoplasmata archaeon]|jgi:hypothetical protein|nr:hypothetical protein [Thermoplasmata archaeon]
MPPRVRSRSGAEVDEEREKEHDEEDAEREEADDMGTANDSH